MNTYRFTDRYGRSPHGDNTPSPEFQIYEFNDDDKVVWRRLGFPKPLDNKPLNLEPSLLGIALEIALAAIALSWVIALIIILTLK